MLEGGKVKAIYELQGKQSIRKIAETLGISRNTVRRYLRDPDGALARKPRPKRPSKLDPYKQYIMQRLAEGVDNCVVLLREIQQQGYTGGYTILKDFVRPLRRRSTNHATMRFETAPGEQAQVDFGSFAYRTSDGKMRRVWGFVMVLSWSRAMYVEFISRPTTETFIRCHLNAFAKFGGSPETSLYDNTKLVVLSRDTTGSAGLEPPILRLRAPRGHGYPALPAISGPDQRVRGKRHQVRQAQLLTGRTLYRPGGSQP